MFNIFICMCFIFTELGRGLLLYWFDCLYITYLEGHRVLHHNVRANTTSILIGGFYLDLDSWWEIVSRQSLFQCKSLGTDRYSADRRSWRKVTEDKGVNGPKKKISFSIAIVSRLGLFSMITECPSSFTCLDQWYLNCGRFVQLSIHLEELNKNIRVDTKQVLVCFHIIYKKLFDLFYWEIKTVNKKFYYFFFHYYKLIRCYFSKNYYKNIVNTEFTNRSYPHQKSIYI